LPRSGIRLPISGDSKLRGIHIAGFDCTIGHARLRLQAPCHKSLFANPGSHVDTDFGKLLAWQNPG